VNRGSRLPVQQRSRPERAREEPRAIEAHDRAIAIQGITSKRGTTRRYPPQSGQAKGALKATAGRSARRLPGRLYNRAGLLVSTGERDKAASDLKRAIKLEPSLGEKALADDELKALLP
jgi:hypothetical protein